MFAKPPAGPALPVNLLFAALVALGSIRLTELLWHRPAEQVGVAVDSIRTHQVFDPGALVVVSVGVDGAPGQAGIDDGANGIVDDASELGATGSDDVCSVVFGDRVDVAREDPMQLVLQTGAFREIQPDDDRGWLASQPKRDLVQDAGREYLVELAD